MSALDDLIAAHGDKVLGGEVTDEVLALRAALKTAMERAERAEAELERRRRSRTIICRCGHTNQDVCVHVRSATEVEDASAKGDAYDRLVVVISYAADYGQHELQDLASSEHARFCQRRTDPRATGNGECPSCATHEIGVRWKPSIHMPRAASRITLEVTGVRVERLQAITEDDARAEGVLDRSEMTTIELEEDLHPAGLPWARPRFKTLWDAINGKRASWEANPFVWCVSFKRLRP
jgi:hypothetical protein